MPPRIDLERVTPATLSDGSVDDYGASIGESRPRRLLRRKQTMVGSGWRVDSGHSLTRPKQLSSSDFPITEIAREHHLKGLAFIAEIDEQGNVADVHAQMGDTRHRLTKKHLRTSRARGSAMTRSQICSRAVFTRDARGKTSARSNLCHGRLRQVLSAAARFLQQTRRRCGFTLIAYSFMSLKEYLRD